MRKIADLVGAYLVVDMAHISGLIAAGVIPSPIRARRHRDDDDTQVSPRSSRCHDLLPQGRSQTDPKTGKETLYDLEGPINFSVFPGHQGGPHNHTITALAVALKQATSPNSSNTRSKW